MYVCIILSLLTIGFEPVVEKFFFYMLTVALLSSAASALAFTISARAPVVAVGILGTAVSFILQVVCM